MSIARSYQPMIKNEQEMKKDAKWTQKQIEKQWEMIFYSRKKTNTKIDMQY